MTFKIKDGPKQIFEKNLSRSEVRDGNELVRIPKPLFSAYTTRTCRDADQNDL